MIRRALKEDVEYIYELGNFLHKDYRKLNDLNKMLNENYFKIFVALEDNKIVGFLSITELYETVDINDLYVCEEYRRHHLASQLINYMISDISDSVLLITLEVSCENSAAIELYKKFGFEVYCKRLFYYDSGDAYLMGMRCKRE